MPRQFPTRAFLFVILPLCLLPAAAAGYLLPPEMAAEYMFKRTRLRKPLLVRGKAYKPLAGARAAAVDSGAQEPQSSPPLGGEEEGRGAIYFDPPGRFRMEVEFAEGKVLAVFDGRDGTAVRGDGAPLSGYAGLFDFRWLFLTPPYKLRDLYNLQKRGIYNSDRQVLAFIRQLISMGVSFGGTRFERYGPQRVCYLLSDDHQSTQSTPEKPWAALSIDKDHFVPLRLDWGTGAGSWTVTMSGYAELAGGSLFPKHFQFFKNGEALFRIEGAASAPAEPFADDLFSRKEKKNARKSKER